MNKKIIYLLAVIVAVLALVAGLAFRMHPAGAPAAQNNMPKNTAALGVLTASTQDSITIMLKDGASKTFILSTTTQVVTRVRAGEVGKSLAQIPAGAQVLVQPSDKNASAAQSVSVMPQPVVANNDSAGPPVVLTGIIVSTTTTSLTINTAGDPALHLALTKDITVLSNVLAGQKGKTLADMPLGSYVQVFGVTGPKGVVVRSIQLLVPLVR